MAKNTGAGSRKGAVKDRHQRLNPATGLWTIFSTSSKKILRVKKSSGPEKGIRKKTSNKTRF